MDNTIVEALREMQSSGQRYAIATVIETSGSVSAALGAKAVINHSGDIIAGWIGGGCADSLTRQVAIEAMANGNPTTISLDMNDEVLGTGMPCGGSMRVFVEPAIPERRLWILGHGGIAESLCALGAIMKLRVTVIDHGADPSRYPTADAVIRDDWNYGQLTPHADDFVVVATQHKGDHQSMKQALTTQVRYIALIASRKRARLVLKYLREDGVNDMDLLRIHAPAGFDLGARTPEGIALSVISEIIACANSGNGAPKRQALEAHKMILLPALKNASATLADRPDGAA